MGIIISNSPYFIESDISSELETTSSALEQGGINPFQFIAASPRCFTTSPTSGRDTVFVSQQRWVKLHSKSENPRAGAPSGLSGRLRS